jgi:hypothetical protein
MIVSGIQRLAVAGVPLSPWGEGWGEGAVIDLSILGTPPSPGADAEAQFQFGHSGRAGLSPRGEARQGGAE